MPQPLVRFFYLNVRKLKRGSFFSHGWEIHFYYLWRLYNKQAADNELKITKLFFQ